MTNSLMRQSYDWSYFMSDREAIVKVYDFKLE